MYKTVVFGCFMTALSLSGIAQVMPLPSMEEIRADLKRMHSDTGRADLLLNLSLSYVFKPGEYKSDLDSAMLWAKQAEEIDRSKDRRIEAKTYFVYSNILREGGDAAKGHEYIERSLALYRTIDAPYDMGEAWIEEANYYSGDDNEMIKKKRENFVQALALFRRSGNRLREADALKNMGDFDMVLGENPRLSMKECKEALTIYQSIGYTQLYGVYIILADLCQEEGDYPNMVRYCVLAIKYAEHTGEMSLQMARIYTETGSAYMWLGNFDTAVNYKREALAIARKYDNLAYTLPIANMLCYSLVQLGRTKEAAETIKDAERIIAGHKKKLADDQRVSFLSMQIMLYDATKQYDKAEACAKECVRILKKYSTNTPVYGSVSVLIRYFINTHQGKEAENYADSLLQFAYAQHVKLGIAKAYLIKSKADSTLGDLRGALTYYQLYNKIEDSMFNEASSFQLAQVQVEYETEKKDNDIKLLQQQQVIQKVRLEHSRVTIIVVIIGVVVLTLLLALLYSRYRIKQRLNTEKDRLISEKDTLIGEKDILIKEKDWLVKEIHHRVKNNLQIVISLLNAQTDFLENPSALSAIQASRERMEAIAIIHQKLYQSENNTLVHAYAYVFELVDNLHDSFANARNIHFQLDVADITLDISQSVPLGLILNEAITNAIKYAYREGEHGTVHISLKPTGDQRVELRITDNGKGLPPDLDWKDSPSLGLQLINLLAQQLKGELRFLNKKGLEIVLVFKPTWYTPGDTTPHLSWPISERSEQQ